MDPDNFRRIRLKINDLNEDIKLYSEKNDAESSKNKLSQAQSLIEELKQEAEGEIQERSVKNLENKLKFSLILIDKIKPAKKPTKKSTKSAPVERIDWDTERLSLLSNNFLSKLLSNMEVNTASKVCMSTTGKGVKPSYQIDFGNGDVSAFSGSNHKQLKRKLPNSPDRISQPFSFSEIKSIFDSKK